MLDHFFSLMVIVFVAGLFVDLASNLFLELRARLLVDLAFALGLGTWLGSALGDVGPLPGALGGAMVFIWLYALMNAQRMGRTIDPVVSPAPVTADNVIRPNFGKRPLRES
jgi:hypothetical protein